MKTNYRLCNFLLFIILLVLAVSFFGCEKKAPEQKRVYSSIITATYIGKELMYANTVEVRVYTTNDLQHYLEMIDYFHNLRLRARLHESYRKLGCYNCPYNIFKD